MLYKNYRSSDYRQIERAIDYAEHDSTYAVSVAFLGMSMDIKPVLERDNASSVSRRTLPLNSWHPAWMYPEIQTRYWYVCINK